MSTVLRVNDITMQFGGVVAVNNLSMHVDEGEIVALIGPNGAGKTTAFNCITGVYEPTNGEVWFHDRLIASNHPSGKMKKLYAGENRGKYTRVVTNTPDRITKMGIARTFQNIRLFKTQTVFENVLIATHLRKKSNLFTATFHLNGREERAMREEVHGASQDRRPCRRGRRDGHLPALRQTAAAGDRPRAGHEADAAFARRAGRGHEPAGDGRTGRFHPRDQEHFKLTVFMIEHHMNLVMDISNRYTYRST